MIFLTYVFKVYILIDKVLPYINQIFTALYHLKNCTWKISLSFITQRVSVTQQLSTLTF